MGGVVTVNHVEDPLKHIEFYERDGPHFFQRVAPTLKPNQPLRPVKPADLTRNTCLRWNVPGHKAHFVFAGSVQHKICDGKASVRFVRKPEPGTRERKALVQALLAAKVIKNEIAASNTFFDANLTDLLMWTEPRRREGFHHTIKALIRESERKS